MDRRKASRQHARLTVLGWVGTFLALQVGLAFSLDTWLGRLRDPHYDARHDRLQRQVKKHPDRPVIVVAGSSRTMNGLCPGSLPDDGHGPILVNWGYPGHAPIHLALRVERLVREGPRPDVVVIEVVPPFLTTPWSEPGPVPRESHRWDDLPTASRIIPTGDLKRDWSEARILPWFSYRRNIMDWAAPAWQPSGQRNDAFWSRLDDWGWFPTLATSSSPEAVKLTAAAFAPMLQRPEVHPDQARALRHVLATCSGENQRVALLLMPEGPTFRRAYATGVREDLDAYLKSLCDEFRVDLIDARDWFDTEDVFCDGHHLIPDGARQFTARFAAEVVPALLRPQSR